MNSCFNPTLQTNTYILDWIQRQPPHPFLQTSSKLSQLCVKAPHQQWWAWILDILLRWMRRPQPRLKAGSKLLVHIWPSMIPKCKKLFLYVGPSKSDERKHWDHEMACCHTQYRCLWALSTATVNFLHFTLTIANSHILNIVGKGMIITR